MNYNSVIFDLLPATNVPPVLYTSINPLMNYPVIWSDTISDYVQSYKILKSAEITYTYGAEGVSDNYTGTISDIINLIVKHNEVVSHTYIRRVNSVTVKNGLIIGDLQDKQKYIEDVIALATTDYNVPKENITIK